MLSAKLKEAAGNSADATLYVDDVFSTYLYTGNGSTQTITNGIDLAGKGGMVWLKSRSAVGQDNFLANTISGATKFLVSNTDDPESTSANTVSAFNSTGFSIGSIVNTNAATYASWTFREAAKFFDVQTVTHTSGTANNIDLSVLGTVGMVIAKINTTAGDWTVWQRGLTTGYNLKLNTLAEQSTTDAWLSVSGTTATLAAAAPTGTYVIYAYAHDTSSTGIIQCGSYTGNGAEFGSLVNLGWEPQWVLVKQIDNGTTTGWVIVDSMRGFCVEAGTEDTGDALLFPNTNGAEIDRGRIRPDALGFTPRNYWNAASTKFMYMAIRRPNKPPTTGTQVYASVARTGTGTVGASTSFGQVTDLVFTKQRSSTQSWAWTDRLRGATKELTSAAATIETTFTNDVTGFDTMTGFKFGSGVSGQINTSAATYVDSLFKRAPGFFDEVCYTGNGSATTQAHNLTVVPELMIVKARSGSSPARDWAVYTAPTGANALGLLDLTNAFSFGVSNYWDTTPTSTVFSIGTEGRVNLSGNNYVAYLFATLAGISKVGSYTGNGTGQAIACGFSAGARFVLIKRTDSTGNWYTFDSARGLTSGSSPYLLLNSTAAEVTGNNGVYASTGGFTLGSTASTTTNINGASYIYLSVA
jgi:hypothetical protein